MKKLFNNMSRQF